MRERGKEGGTNERTNKKTNEPINTYINIIHSDHDFKQHNVYNIQNIRKCTSLLASVSSGRTQSYTGSRH